MARALLAALFALLAPAAPASAADFRAVSGEAAILYDAPSAQARRLYIVNRGYPLEVLVVVKGWVKVRDAAGTLSWVEATQVSDSPRMVMVKVPLAQVRQAARDTAPVVFQAQQNVVMEVTEGAGSWLRVRHRDGASGYVRISQVWGA
jgi:SH3-like domain-containing protein